MFEGVCLNSRHLAPGACWGNTKLQLVDRIRWIVWIVWIWGWRSWLRSNTPPLLLTFAVRALPLGLLLALLVLNSEKLVWEQRSFTFAVRAPPLGAAAGACAEFREAGFGATLLHFCCPQC